MARSRSGDPQLTESMFFILAALAEPLHGYGIMQRAREASGGSVVLGPGTLYGALVLLQDKGFIRRGSEPEDARGKKTYVITDAGRKALAEEAGRLAAMARVGLAAARRGSDHG